MLACCRCEVFTSKVVLGDDGLWYCSFECEKENLASSEVEGLWEKIRGIFSFLRYENVKGISLLWLVLLVQVFQIWFSWLSTK